MRFRYLLLISLLWLLGTLRANAQLEVDLSVNPLSGAAGQTVRFQATLVNLGVDPLYLNGVDLSGVPGGLTVDPSPLFSSFPASPTAALPPGDSYSGDLFDVTIDPSLMPGSYTGGFTILGGTDALTQTDVADVSFEVDVALSSAVPEPGSLIGMLGLGISGGIFTRRRLRNRSRQP